MASHQQASARCAAQSATLWLLASTLVASADPWQHPSSASAAFALNTATLRVDTDGDGMPDAWEAAHGLNPLLDDRWLDPDHDGASNWVEYNRGTDPQQSDLVASEARSDLFSLALVQRPLDTDGDGMPDAWEIAHGLNPGVNDAQADLDGDGLTNLAEYNADTDPQVRESQRMAFALSPRFICDSGGFPLGYLADSDSDGMPDWWEVRYGLNPFVDDANGDIDGDGWSNLEEFRQGTRPNFNEITGGAWALSHFFRLDTAGRPADTDGDGMPDWWELAHGLDPNRPDANEDADGDGLTNLTEYNSGTDPQVDDWRGPSRANSPLFTTDTGGFWGGYVLDSDGDGMPDWWEVAYGFNPMLNDAQADADGDGIPNGLEYALGLDPLVAGEGGLGLSLSGSFPLRTVRDDDHDGMDDDWEQRMFGVPHAAPGGDADRDGLTNLQEFQAGTFPTDPSSTLVIFAESSPTPGGKQIRWQSARYRTYAVDRATDLSQGFTRVVAAGLIATPPQNTFLDTTATNAGNYFYRVRVILPP